MATRSPGTAPAALADARFVSLTTYRRTGEPVPTPVWLVRDGDALLVTTPAASGKVKRLRAHPRVELRPCDRRGRVDADAPVATGEAEILGDPATVRRCHALFRRRYGLEYRIAWLAERVIPRGRRTRVILRITDRPA